MYYKILSFPWISHDLKKKTEKFPMIVVRSGRKITAFESPPVFDVTAGTTGTQVAQVAGTRWQVAGGDNRSFKTMIPGSVSRRTIVPGIKNGA